ncbi:MULTISPECIES: SPFH domain-containing protein [Crocosphaera]|uniref:Stomatin/prohibitin-family membrane protease subunit YbbK n=3 Tax=Crocosphaera watsonii TaxID=263511 RepID=G5JAT1_CROWT|nr:MULTISPECIES: SPFH domain-containing protein [Crocosphaera]EHJ10703.1 Putative stomatin/prohibitin-family membrane protease subunit YbbK [Crocosphaera watsonii WH 0003]MCH2246988.1 SPFH/Band 7/PHB domain protein [Crocosphaera sp.]CCQ57238.1 Putative stomatin/prohibitin-family membrane protease subunit YbbK [Crocosphaera watsonii WH 0005]CCQ68739.1 Putative stomatin/prohibitin-family membrane protease subunit YbbK [Crocosphaera watsonii WH 0402]
MGQFFFFVILLLGGSTVFGSVKIVNEKNEYLVERLGSYNKKLSPGLNFIVPFVDRVVYKETVREKVIDIPPQSCITKDNVSITVDAVVYWRIMDMEKAYYKVESLQSAMVNLVLTQIRSEIGKLELDQTFTARTEINEILLRELDISTDPWGVKVTRVELRDIMPSKAVQDSMELQMAAERKKRAAILTSEGERDSAINSAQGKAESRILEAEAQKKAEILRAEAERQQQILKAEAIARAIDILTEKLKTDPSAGEALQFLLAQNYLDLGVKIGSSDSSKVMFMDPRNIMSTLEGVRSVVGFQSDEYQQLTQDLEKIDRHLSE